MTLRVLIFFMFELCVVYYINTLSVSVVRKKMSYEKDPRVLPFAGDLEL